MRKDISRKALEKATMTLLKVQELLYETLPMGPRVVGMSRQDVRRQLKEPSPSFMAQLIKAVGEEEAMKMLVSR